MMLLPSVGHARAKGALGALTFATFIVGNGPCAAWAENDAHSVKAPTSFKNCFS
jgi:hypothetical protein